MGKGRMVMGREEAEEGGRAGKREGGLDLDICPAPPPSS